MRLGTIPAGLCELRGRGVWRPRVAKWTKAAVCKTAIRWFESNPWDHPARTRHNQLGAVIESLSVEERLALIRRDTEEILNEDLLQTLLARGMPLRHYIGFEISGRVHLGAGLMAMGKVRDFQEAGLACTVFLADWHSWINDKLGGDLELIRAAAHDYFGEALKHCLRTLGADPERVRFILASALYEDDPSYWATMMDAAKHTSLNRAQRSVTILGRQEGQSLDLAKFIYPVMQAADIFALGANVAHAGIDQRKAHVIANDVALKLREHRLLGPDGETVKPVAVHHPLIMGLTAPPAGGTPEERAVAMKMSKSNPLSAVFVDDTEDEIRDKVRRAYCPPGQVEDNPILNWAEHLVFGAMRSELSIERKPEHGGPLHFTAYEELATTYGAGGLHPADLKGALATWLVDVLAGVRAALAGGRAAEIRARLQ